MLFILCRVHYASSYIFQWGGFGLFFNVLTKHQTLPGSSCIVNKAIETLKKYFVHFYYVVTIYRVAEKKIPTLIIF